MCLFPTEKHKGGLPAEADQLLPEVEEEVLQAARTYFVLRTRLQGNKQLQCQTRFAVHCMLGVLPFPYLQANAVSVAGTNSHSCFLTGLQRESLVLGNWCISVTQHVGGVTCDVQAPIRAPPRLRFLVLAPESSQLLTG